MPNRTRKMAAVVVCALVVLLAALLRRTPSAWAETTARTFYVSRSGNNADGTTWARAWNELSRINWGAVQPGDTIVIDGGASACPALGPGYNCGMVYNSTLTVGKSGTQQAPITIRLSTEPGRNGTAIIDGGIRAWSRCSEYAAEPTPPSTPGSAGTRDTGVNLGSSQWIILDGTHWGGIEIRNHTRYGLNLSGSRNVQAQFLKIHHNTDPANALNHAVGITQNYLSAYITLSRVEVFRNGQDAIRGGGDFLTVEDSYIHDQYCNHPDGIQSFVPTSNSTVPDDAGEVVGLVVRRNVFDRIAMQSILLGENSAHQSWNRDVIIEGNLFLNTDYAIKSAHGNSTTWTIRNNTLANVAKLGIEWCCATPGAKAPMTINHNVFSQIGEGAHAFVLPTGGGATTFSDNCLSRVGRITGQVTQSNNQSVDLNFSSASGADYSVTGVAGCAGKGASITSVNELLGLPVMAAMRTSRGPNEHFFPIVRLRR